MADVFLSYAREDTARAEQIARALGDAGIEVFWDNEIPPGTTWADYIEQKLTQCKALIVLWSENSTKSQWVREEARMGRDKGVLIPVMIDASTPPFGFGEVQAANLASWNGETDNPNWRRFADAVTRFAKSDAKPAPAAMPAEPPRAAYAPSATQPAAPTSPAAKSGVPIWVWIGGAVVAAVAVIAVISSMAGGKPQQQIAENGQPTQPAMSAPAQTPPTTDESPQAIILSQLQSAQAALAQQGYQLIGQPYSGGLQQGQTWNVPAQLSTGVDYRVIGVCDRDCADLDLVMFDANASPLVQDRSTTSQPIIGIQPAYTGNYTIQVQMYNCSVAPCYYAIALYGKQM